MHLGLRAKSVLALLGSILLVLALAIAAGWRIVQYTEENLGSAYARNVTRLNRQRILTPVLRELALSQQFAESRVTLNWLNDEKDPTKRDYFFQEAKQYQKSFEDHSYFLIARDSKHYYFNDNKSTFSDRPRYSLHKTDPNDAWFFNTMKSNASFNINVDRDTKLKVTKVWFNVLVKENGRNIGLAGTGLALTPFLNRFITNSEPGITPAILDTAGDIQAYPDPRLIDYSSINDKGTSHSTVFQLLKNPEDIAAMRKAMVVAKNNSELIPVFWATFAGSPKLVAVAFVPNLNWFAVTAVDLKTAQVLDEQIWLPLFLTGIALLVLLIVSVMLAVNRILLKPLLRLTDSVQTVAAGNYDVQLPPAGGDELGALTKAFASMTQRVKSHTAELEDRVAERTSELMNVNRKIDDSIQYARLIQNAILPGREMDTVLKDNYFVLWQPRDVVGGDFYLFRSSPQGCLVGIIDCAGHGVPGAFMTMITHSALNVAIETLGLTDPAALLSDVDERIRAILQEEIQETLVATHLDAGLVYIDYAKQVATYSGAKTSLYYCRDSQVNELKGSRYAIGGKRANNFTNQQIAATPDVTFYFSTDGILDQAGGNRGYGFGNKRFTQFLQNNSHLSFSEQRKVLLEELTKYQGSLPRRDDVTVLGFRIKVPGDIA
jgi:serine phosphatase RsbU (regulator of sigma subunit)